METFRQNAVDIFMDCPSRERAGWLCDSFFTGRAEYALTGDVKVERNFLENFLLAEKFEYLPEGMLPMCYPADHYDGNFIPNWALWFVLELEEYLWRSGDNTMVHAFKDRVLGILKYFSAFRNEDGLLEKLEAWIFVEWSRANDLVQDINYPTNMVYSAAMAAAGRLYGMQELVLEAESIAETIRKQAFDGEFFIDNAIREEGKVVPTGNRTEVCQYYAFFCGIASPDTHTQLWNTLLKKFGPLRDVKLEYPDIYPANMLMGIPMRLLLLSRFNCISELYEEIVQYLYLMCQRTGTLWEHTDEIASCNHGFASFIAEIIIKDILGIKKFDINNKCVHIRPGDIGLTWCEGCLPISSGIAFVRWERAGEEFKITAELPDGWEIIKDM